jgi:hypothetical protein
MTGEGVYEALEAVTRAVLEHFEQRLPGERGADMPGFDVPEGGLAEALRGMGPQGSGSEPPDAARGSSTELRLSQLPEQDPGEAAARLAVGEAAPQAEPIVRPALPHDREPSDGLAESSLPPAPQFAAARGASFELLWPPDERGLVRELEAALANGDFSRALAGCEALVARSLAGAAAALGTNDAPRDPATVAVILGVDGRRYLEFRSLAREARSGRGISATEALIAYALAIEIRIARAGVAG